MSHDGVAGSAANLRCIEKVNFHMTLARALQASRVSGETNEHPFVAPSDSSFAQGDDAGASSCDSGSREGTRSISKVAIL